MGDAVMPALIANHRGGSAAFGFGHVPVPDLQRAEILVEVHAAGITFAELDWDETWTRDGHPRFPVIPAHEFSGVVAGVGVEAIGFRVGDAVFGLVPFDENGAAAGFVSVPTGFAVLKPESMSDVTAAALPLAALTAHQALFDHGRLQRDQHVLVHGGAGSIGAMTVQLAVASGADVTVTAREPEHQFIRSLGARHVMELEGFDTLPDRYDLVIDCIGGEVAARSLPTIKPGGRLVCLTATPPGGGRDDIEQIFFVVVPQPAVLSELANRVTQGSLRVVVAETFTLESGREAYASGLRRPRKSGKTVITISG